MSSERTAALVGRQREVLLIRRTITEAGRSSTTVLDMTGAQGIGKSALLTVTAESAATAGFTCACTSGFRQEQDLPYSVIAGLLGERHLDLVRKRLSTPELAALAAVVPALATVVPEPRGSRREGMPHAARVPRTADDFSLVDVLHAIRRGMQAVAGPHGLALIIDGYDWVDDSSRVALEYVLRRGIRSPLLVATAARTPDRTHSLRESVTNSVSIELGGLSDDSLRAIAPAVTPELQGVILARAEGNPFFAIELSRHANAADAADPDAPTSASRVLNLPPTVTDAVMSDLAAVSAQARSFAQAAAVLGDGCEASSAGALAELTEHAALAALDELVASGMVLPKSGGEVRFRHSLVGTAVYEAIPPGRRLGLHSVAARQLQDGGDLIAAARHLIASSPTVDAAAIDLITAAALSRRGTSPRVTAELARAAVDLIPSSGPLTVRLPMLKGIIADSLIRTGSFAEAEVLLRQALLLLSPDDATARAWLTVTYIRVQRWLGRNDSAVDALSSALAEVPTSSHFERAILEGLLVVEMSRVPDVVSMREYADLAMASASASGEPSITLSILVARALAEAVSGDPAIAMELTVAADDMAVHLPEEHVVQATDAIAILAAVEDWLCRSDSALRWAIRGREMAVTADNQMAEFWFTTAATTALMSLGRLPEAARKAEAAEVLARGMENPVLTAVGLALTAGVSFQRGEVLRTRVLVSECLAFIDCVQDANVRLSVVSLLLPALVGIDRPDEAVDLVLVATRDPHLPEIAQPQRACVYEQLAMAELQRGALDAAQIWVDHAVQSAEFLRLPMSVGAAERASARVRAAAGDDPAALAAARNAVATARSGDRPLDLALALRLNASMAAQLGNTKEVIDACVEAADIFTTCGAGGEVAKVRGMLRDLGVRSQGRRSTHDAIGVGALSIREREVADLVAAGASNADIAEQLFLSVRTVESHVSRILRKLDVASRSGIAEVVARSRISG